MVEKSPKPRKGATGGKGNPRDFLRSCREIDVTNPQKIMYPPPPSVLKIGSGGEGASLQQLPGSCKRGNGPQVQKTRQTM